MPRQAIIRYCPKCNNELGTISIRFASKNYANKRLKNLYYCETCEKLLKEHTEFIEF